MRLQRRLTLVAGGPAANTNANPTPGKGGMMKVAFCTQDMQHVDAHFGWAKNIVVYNIDTEGYSLAETLQFGGSLFEDGNEDKLAPKLEALKDVAIVYLSAIGASAAARIVAKNIHPVKVDATEAIAGLLDRLVDTINGNPPPWLKKALNRGQPKTIDFDDEED